MKAKMMALAAVLLGAMTGFAIELPEFDAATITGDELVALFADRKPKLARDEYDELSRRLDGRKLTFHGFAIDGCSECSPKESGTPFSLHLSTVCPPGKGRSMHGTPDDRFVIVLRFSNPKDVRFAKRVYGSGGLVMVKELSGVVVTGQKSFDRRGNLTLDATALVPEQPIEELPDFDAAKVTGDELVKICNQLKRGLSDTIYQDLNALLLDRELTFNDVQVIEARERADGFTDVSCCVGSLMPMLWVYSKESCLCLVARVPTKSIDALPWGFANGVKIRRLTGRVTEPFECGIGRSLQGLPLANVSLDVAWQNERLPTFDPATMTGDELIAVLTKLEGENAFAQRERILRMVAGRRLTFSEGRVKNFSQPYRKKETHVIFGFGEKKHFRYACELEAVFPEGEESEIVRNLTGEQKVTNLSGVFALSTVDPLTHSHMNGVERWHQLTEVAFDAEAPVPLPDFDEKTITGDELAQLVLDMPSELSPAHVADLQKRLAGRRLTFHQAARSGASGGVDGWTDIRFKLGRKLEDGTWRTFAISAQLRELLVEPTNRKRRGADWTVTGVVADPAEVGSLANFFLKDAEIK